jgi:hypothetical protein
LHGKGQIWNYDNAAMLPQNDHEFLSGGLSAQYRFTSTSLLRVTANAYQRRFGERPSFDLDGRQPTGNPAVRYDYTEFGATARQRITRNMWFGLNYARTTRTDQHAGYNDYIRDSYGVQLSLRLSDRFRLQAAANYLIYGYDNAFAYNVAAAGRKTLDTGIAHVSASWRLSKSLSLIGEYDYYDSVSNDARIAYTRSQYVLGLRWAQ